MIDYANPGEDLLRKIDIHSVLPQQEPFVAVGCLTRFGRNSSTTETEILADNIFVDGGELSVFGMVENMAQTCAARIGYYNKYVLHNEVQIGFIGAIRNFCVISPVSVGDVIVTTVDIIEEVFGMTLANAVTRCEGTVVATAEIKLSIKDL